MHRRENLILEHLYLVRRIARRMSVRTGADISFLQSAGMVGLVEAAERYDPKKEKDFSKYASSRVRGAMLDDLRKEDYLSRWERDHRKQDSSRAEKVGHKFSTQRVYLEDQDAWDLISVHSADQMEKLEQKHLHELLTILPMKLKRVMKMYYFEDKTDKEIGQILAPPVTGSRVGFMRAEAVGLIHIHLRKKGIL